MTTTPWRKSSHSDNEGGACVEARLSGGAHLQLSDSQHAGTRPIIDVAKSDYAALLETIKTTNV